MIEELKPCPFCGGEAEVWNHHYEEKDITLWLVRCKERPYEAERACYASDSFISFDTKEEAIEAWNTRAERTCKNVYDEMKMGACDNGFECSECGEKVEDCEGYHVKGTWNYCPGCRAKVVD